MQQFDSWSAQNEGGREMKKKKADVCVWKVLVAKMPPWVKINLIKVKPSCSKYSFGLSGTIFKYCPLCDKRVDVEK